MHNFEFHHITDNNVHVELGKSLMQKTACATVEEKTFHVDQTKAMNAV